MLETISIPLELQKLPVAKRLDSLDYNAPMVVKADCGSGKTMGIPPYWAAVEKAAGRTPCIALRVPTKLAGSLVASGLKMFWGGQGISIATLNRDVDAAEEKACATADVVVISDGSLQRLMDMRRVTHYILDEAHALSLAAELDLAKAKRAGLKLAVLSATMDERPFIEYLGPTCNNYFIEGRAFPISKKTIWASESVFKRDDRAELYDIVDGFVRDLVAKKETAIVFLCTRLQCEEASSHYQARIASTFLHGGVSPREAEKWLEEHRGKAAIVFATTAAAMSVTLDLHTSVVSDEMVSSVVERGVEHTQVGPMDDNMIIQASSRAGRIRAGDCYLITHGAHRAVGSDPWLSIAPRAVVAPSEKATPYEVVLSLAREGIVDAESFDLLGHPDPQELAYARGWLKANGCIDDTGALTRLGKRVASFPMGAQQAHCIVTAPSVKAQVVLHAAFCLGLQGTYGLVKAKPRSKELAFARRSNKDFTIVPKDCIIRDSVPLSLAAIVREAVRLEEPRNIYRWADANNMWAKSLFVARKDFIEGSKAILDGAKRALLVTDFNDPKLRAEVHDHLRRHPLYSATGFEAGFGRRPAFDAVFADAFYYGAGDDRDYNAWGIKKVVRKPGMQFVTFDLGFAEEVPLEA